MTVDRSHGDRNDRTGDEVVAESLEEIRTATGAIADIVTDKVGDNSRISRVIFWDVGLNFPNQVGADIR